MSQPVFTPQIETNRTGWRYLSLILPIVIAAICLWMAVPNAAVSRGVGFQPANLSSAITSDAIPVSLPASSPKLITRPIETIRPGMRVLADNPELTEALPDADVNPQDWRLVSLQMTKENGGTLNVQLLRPIEWLVTEAVVLIVEANDPKELFVTPAPTTAADGTVDLSLQRLLLGQSIYLDLPELGAQGPATVTAIDVCPSLDPVVRGRRLVTGTFRHSAANVIDVQIGSESEPFGVTDNHPFWSLDREQFVEAGQLEIGEHLQCADTTITQVTRITPRRGPPVEVYNFEVDAEHVYHVGDSGVLVHNACHHYWPRWLGSQVPYRHSSLTPMTTANHSALHTALRGFLQRNHPGMMHGPGNSGTAIQATTRMRDRLAAFEDFYTTYDGGSHLSAFQNEVLSTILSGLWR